MPTIDLHMHSNASDGVFPPSRLVHAALERSMDVIALTDHDTLQGLDEAIETAQGTALEVLAGIELGCEDGKRDIHVLGYDFDHHDSYFVERLQEMQDYRLHRAEEIIKKLASLGIIIDYQRVLAIAGTGVVARPHIAKALIEAKAVKSIGEAFDKYLGLGAPAYVPRFKLSATEAVDLIHGAGGVAVVAHPCRYDEPLDVVHEFAAHGVDGVEVYYPDNDALLREELLSIAKDLDLIVTGGCDFHRPAGDGKWKLGCEDVPSSVIDEIKECSKQYKA